MFGFKIVYVLPEGEGGGMPNLGDVGIGGAGLLGLLVVGAVIVAASSAGKDEGDSEEEQFEGSVMIIDGCKDCGNFWFDRKELKTVTVAEKIRGAKEWEEGASTITSGLSIQPSGRATNTNCLHVDERSGKKCRRVNYRGTEYCYMHQQD
jgi:Zn-finger nucleic acid-binding protein